MSSIRPLCALLVAVLSVGVVGCDLNLKDQTRYTVDDRVYGLSEVVYDASVLEVSLGAVSEETVEQADADAIFAVPGIVLVDSAGTRLAMREVRYAPEAGENGYVVLVFDISGSAEPWTLEWPGHDPEPIGR